MAFAIPKIEYKNVDTTGDASIGSGVILSLPDTSEIEVGFFVRGTGIPAGATVGSKTDHTVTLASGVLATATNVGTALAFGLIINFAYPPKEVTGGAKKPSDVLSESLSGVQQISTNYIEVIRSLAFSFVSHSIYLQVNTFLETWACFGKEFRYYDDKTLTSYQATTLEDRKVEPKKQFGKGVDVFIWEIPMKFRRLL